LELISGPGYNTEKAAAVINSRWALYPVHPSKHFYVKMALNLLEKIASQGKLSGQQRSDSRKRTWSSSNQSDQSGRGGGHNNAGGTSSGGWQTARTSNGRRGDAGTASGLPTLAAPTAAACTNAETAAGDR
jgi:hypothetical protein